MSVDISSTQGHNNKSACKSENNLPLGSTISIVKKQNKTKKHPIKKKKEPCLVTWLWICRAFQSIAINWNILSINHVIPFKKDLNLVHARKNSQLQSPHLLFSLALKICPTQCSNTEQGHRKHHSQKSRGCCAETAFIWSFHRSKCFLGFFLTRSS